MKKQEKKLNKLINTMRGRELKDVLMLVSSISQYDELNELKIN